MFSKQNLLATLAATIVMFLLGYAIWGIATAEFYAEHTNADLMKGEDEMNLGLIFVGNLLASFAMSSLYGKWARGHHSTGGGFQFGAWFGLFIGLGLGLLQMGTANLMDATGYAVEAVLDIVFYGIIGLVIALVYRAAAKKEAS